MPAENHQIPRSKDAKPYSKDELATKLAKLDPKESDRLLRLEALRRGLSPVRR